MGDVKFNGQKDLMVRGAEGNRHVEMRCRIAECIPRPAQLQINYWGWGLLGALL